MWAIRSFRHYLHGAPFQLITDHQPLKWLLTTRDLSGGEPARWMVQEHFFEVVNHPGTENVNADVLSSRFPLPSTYDPTGARIDVDHEELQASIEDMQGTWMPRT